MSDNCPVCECEIDKSKLTEHFIKEHSVKFECWRRFIGTFEDMVRHIDEQGGVHTYYHAHLLGVDPKDD